MALGAYIYLYVVHREAIDRVSWDVRLAWEWGLGITDDGTDERELTSHTLHRAVYDGDDTLYIRIEYLGCHTTRCNETPPCIEIVDDIEEFDCVGLV